MIPYPKISRQKALYAALGLIVLLTGTLLRAHLQGSVVLPPGVTRAEAAMVLLLSRMPRVPPLKNLGRFQDVEQGAWYEAYVVNAEKYGILQADPLGRIRPNDPVNRAEFLKMMTNTYGLAEALPHRFWDVDPGDWYDRYAGIAQEFQLFPNARASMQLSPGRPVTHAEASAAIQMILNARGTNFPPLEQLAATRELLRNRAKPYLTISTLQEEVTVAQTPTAYQKAASRRGKAFPLPHTFFQDLIDGARLGALREDVLTLLNEKRSALKLSPLAVNATLQASAQAYAAQMAQEKFFAHVTPEGLTFKQRIETSGYYDAFFLSNCLLAHRPVPRSQEAKGGSPAGQGGGGCVRHYLLGENLARGQKTAQEVLDAWLQSPKHKKAILHPDFTEVGIGYENGYWVQHFGGMTDEASL